MQVVRELFCLQKIVKWRTGEYRVGNLPPTRDNIAKAMLIPDNIKKISVFLIKGGLYI